MDCDMFKRCALSEKSNKVFSEIIKNLGRGYMPHNFTDMIIYLVYLSKREEIKKRVAEEKLPIKEKIANVQNLLRLKDLVHNNERLNIHADNFKHNLRSKFRDIWERVNENYGQKFPYTPKMEEEFYEYYKNNKSKAQL